MTGQRVQIYTDGACSGNPGPAGAGVLLEYQGTQLLLSKYLGTGTNNIAELTAVKMALEAMKDRNRPVDLHSDSSYVIGLLTKNWKARQNTELVEEIRRLLSGFRDVRFIKVKGHAGIAKNELADELARKAVETRKDMQERKSMD